MGGISHRIRPISDYLVTGRRRPLRTSGLLDAAATNEERAMRVHVGVRVVCVWLPFDVNAFQLAPDSATDLSSRL